jgi:FAD/FMN-containing dehydrogenase
VSTAIDAAALKAELERDISGEVRFDAISRALYSTDASVYQIKPIGAAIPKTRHDIIRIVEICVRFGCPITMRGGGTSQAGQAIGEGLQVDISKYYNRLLEVNAEERWARVEPGIVLDELNAQLAPLRLRFAPDISTASRATIGGMMANNSSGARSVIYGKTIDHVLEQTVVLSDGTSPSSGKRSARPSPPGIRSKPRSIPRCCGWLSSTPPKSTVGIPRCCGAWAATTSMSLRIRPSL